VEEAFWDEAKRLARYPEPEDWRKLLDEFVKAYDPEYIGKALANAALAGEVNELQEDPRVQGFIKKEGDVARFEEWWRVRPKKEEEYERGVQACAERLQEIEEGIAELRSWVPEPGEALSLRMHAELEMARFRETVEEEWSRTEEVEARIHVLEKLADEYLLPRHALDSLRDWARRLREALMDLDAMLK
jgi:DNA repair ATPase RecN